MKKVEKNLVFLVAVILLLALALQSQASLVCHLEMEELSWKTAIDEVVDSSGNGNHGIAFSGATTTSGGVLGRCGSFDGINDAVSVYDSGGTGQVWPDLANYTAKTVIFWIKPLAGNTNAWAIPYHQDYWSANGGDLVRFDGTTNQISFYVKNSGGIIVNEENHSIPLNQWTMVGYSWDGTTVNYYINGVSIGTPDALSGTMGPLVGPEIGLSTTNRFKGNIDEFRIYNNALTATEVAGVYNSIPEPATTTLLLGGALGMVIRRKK